MKKLLLLLLSFNAYAVDPTLDPVSYITCTWPTERENNKPFPIADRGGINLYRSNISGVYDSTKVIATITTVCEFTIDNTLLTDGDHHFVLTAFDTDMRESIFTPEIVHNIERTLPPKPPTAVLSTPSR